jgi:hypothetical protein
MSAASSYLERSVLDHTLKNSAFTQPSVLYVALFTGTPAANLQDGTLTAEVSSSGTAYARQAITFSAASTTGSGLSAVTTASNSATVTFPTATASFGTITYVAIMDNATRGAGNVLFFGAVTTSKSIDTGDTFQITSGNLTIALA